jgi:hypothetical protein
LQLPRLTRRVLYDLAAHVAAAHPTYREGSDGRAAVLINLRNIGWALARRDMSP